MALNLELIDTFLGELFLNSFPISFPSFCSSLSCNSVPRSGCTAFSDCETQVPVFSFAMVFDINGKSCSSVLILFYKILFYWNNIVLILLTFYATNIWQLPLKPQEMATKEESVTKICRILYFLEE